jgi:SIR2-like protein
MSGMTEQAATSASTDASLEAARELEQHCRLIANEVLEGRVVPVLGAGVNTCERSPTSGWGAEDLPSSGELAKYLADDAAYEPELYRLTPSKGYEPIFDLVKVAQYVEVAKGTRPLHEALHKVFTRKYGPTVVHRFLARLAKVVPARRQLLMLTTNYDDALEQALREVDVPYDVVTYVTDYPERTRGYFTHSFWEAGMKNESKPGPILRAKECTNLLEGRPAIVKIHGATRRGRTVDEDNYVITEDDYIDFLANKDVTRSLPVGVGRRLRISHFLFLGYALRDWNLRVLLRRIWREQPRTSNSWSVRLEVDEMEGHWWERQGVRTLRHPLPEYILALRQACLRDFLDSISEYPPNKLRKALEETHAEALFEPFPGADDWDAVFQALPAEHLKAVLEALPDDPDEASTALPEALVEEIRKRVQTQPTAPPDG